MSKHFLYEVRLKRGRDNRNFSQWHSNVSELNAKGPDYSGIIGLCVLSHSQNQKTVHLLCTQGFKTETDARDVEVVEITGQTLAQPDSNHQQYSNLIDGYFLPHNTYPNI